MNKVMNGKNTDANNEVQLNLSDIESCRLSSVSYSDINNETLVGILKNSNENEQHTKVTLQYCVNIITIFTILLINLPLIILDLYYAVNNNGVHSFTIKTFNLSSYLFVSGISTVVEVGIMLSILYSNMYKIFNITNTCVYIILIIRTIIGLLLTIIGSILFWITINIKTHYENGFYKYVFAQLIIKFIVIVFNSRRLVDNKYISVL